MNNNPWLAITAPAFNEEENIQRVVEKWMNVLKETGLPFEIVITNDGSTDKTGQILTELQNKYSELKVVTLSPNHGYGYALQSAIQAATANYVMTIDSDGQFDVSFYKALFLSLQNNDADLVTGYRLRKKDTILNVFFDRCLNFIVRFFFNVPFRDTNCAQKLAKTKVLQRINIEAMGYPTPTEILIKAKTLGYNIEETGVQHYKRDAGISKLHPIKTSFRFLIFLFYLKFKIFLFHFKIIQTI